MREVIAIIVAAVVIGGFLWTLHDDIVELTTALGKLEQQVSILEKAEADEGDSLVQIPVGAVMAFNLSDCPDGWDDYELAWGRFIRGIDKGSTNLDPEGRRTLGSTQDEAFVAHNHTRPRAVIDMGGLSRIESGGGVPSGNHYGYGHAKYVEIPPTGNTGGRETRPDNVALLYCIRS